MKLHRPFAFASLLLLLATVAPAATVDLPTDAEMIRASGAIVRGTVLSQQVRSSPDGMIETVTRVGLSEVLKGKLDRDETLEIVDLGGFIGNRGLIVPGSASYQPGESVVLFLGRNPRNEWTTWGMSLGKFTRGRDAEGERVLVRDSREISSALDADSENRPRVRAEAGFVTYIRNVVAGNHPAADYRGGKTGDILFTPDSEPFPPSAFLYHFGDAQNPLRPTRRTIFDSRTGTLNVFSVGSQPGISNSTTLLTQALGAWSNPSFSFVQLNYAGAAPGVTSAAEDNVNTVLFNDPADQIPTGSPFVALTFLWVSGAENSLKGETFYTLLETDTVVQNGVSPSAFVELLTHEIGHQLGLRHSNGTSNINGGGPLRDPQTTDAIMTFPITGAYGTTLQLWDRLAVSSAYGVGLTCAAPSISTQPAPRTIERGQQANLSVTASGTTSLTYQWYQGVSGDTSQPISGATGTNYTTPLLQATTSYWVRVSSTCALTTNSATATITVINSSCEQPSVISQPASMTVQPGQTVTLSVGASGTAPLSYQWYFGASGDVSNQVAGATSSSLTRTVSTTSSFWVRIENNCGSANSQTATVTAVQACVPVTITTQPTGRTIESGQNAPLFVLVNGTSPFGYQWFRGQSGDVSQPLSGATSASITTPVLTGTTSFWVRVSNGCNGGTTVNSNTATVMVNEPVCSAPAVPLAAVIPGVPSNLTYSVSWPVVPRAGRYEVEESASENFATVLDRKSVIVTEAFFIHLVTQPGNFFYRVRAFASCNPNLASGFSEVVRVRVEPPPPPAPPSANFDTSVPVGATTTITYQIQIPGTTSKQGLDSNFTATTDKPFLTVTPSSGTIPPTGTTLTVTAASTGLSIGANTGTIMVTNPSTNTSIAAVPVSVSLVAPAGRAGKTTPPDNALIIPGVAHVGQFQSDVRIANTASQNVRYQMTFTPTQTDGTQVGRQTDFEIKSGQTVALNDIVQKWYGLSGAAGDIPSNGTLEIRPINFNQKGVVEPDLSAFTTIGSSRTFAATPNGTFGQFIPALAFAGFVGKSADATRPTRLSLQQIAQSPAYRTNLGLVEGAGQPATVEVKAFDTTGRELIRFEERLAPGEHRQMNSILADPRFGINNLTDGRFEVTVTSATGRITAFASVVDNQTSDPLLVSPANLNDVSTNRWVIPGVADINNAIASWRTDIRIFNSGNASTTARLTYYAQGQVNNPRVHDVTISAGQILVIDNTLQTLFGIMNSGGSVVVSTPSNAPLVVTGRTYNQRPNGTYGQFVPAVTVPDSLALGARPLQILQLEESPKFRTNIGLAEVSGRPVRVELALILPDQSFAPVREVSLQANEFIQLNRVLNEMNGGRAVYNGRVSVKVLSGDGSATAYASVVDNQTQDPTFVPAQ